MLHQDYQSRLPNSPLRRASHSRSSSADRFLPYPAGADLVMIDPRGTRLSPAQPPPSATAQQTTATTAETTAETATYQRVLLNEIIGPTPATRGRRSLSAAAALAASNGMSSPASSSRDSSPLRTPTSSSAAVSSPRKMKSYGGSKRENCFASTSSLPSVIGGNGEPPMMSPPPQNPFSLTPLSADSVRLLSAASGARRHVAAAPFKVLEAPGLADDFYVSPLDWSEENIIAVALSQGVFLWNASTTSIARLIDANCAKPTVTSVAWRKLHPGTIAVGSRDGTVSVWDSVSRQAELTLAGHTKRVGVLAWHPRGNVLATGSRDRAIALFDIRSQSPPSACRGHTQEVCGVKWDPDGVLLASGGNDNKLVLWDSRNFTAPLATFDDHLAAVKAIAWSPRTRGALVSGGGSADRCLRFWDSQTLRSTGFVDTGSQVCNLHWSRNVDEIVSTHGYSQNQVLVWDAPSRTPIATLRGHESRVLHLACSPDGRVIVTGAGDQTLHFWNVFPAAGETSAAGSLAKSVIPGCCPMDLR